MPGYSKNLIFKANAKGFNRTSMGFTDGEEELVLRGIPVSAGICHGQVLVLNQSTQDVPHRSVQESEIPIEINRFQRALIETRKEILDVQRRVSEAMGAQDASIFEAHLLVLEDSTLVDEVLKNIRERHENVEYAFQQAADKYVATLASIDDDFIRERASDMRDATDRILRRLLGISDDPLHLQIKEPCILISHDLAPSTTALLDRSKILGFATAAGSKTSHTAILARSLRIPATVGLKDATEHLHSGQVVLLDGINGLVIANPSQQTLFEYGKLAKKRSNFDQLLETERFAPCVTKDGTIVEISANIEQAGGAKEVTACGAAGVGLFRTEYLYIYRNDLPTEDEQLEAYNQVAAEVAPHDVVIRTLDLGGDKLLTHLQLPKEMNPFLGWRAIRFCLHQKDIFRHQIRAILRASVHGNVKMMYPMITSIAELDEANAFVNECKTELRSEGIAFNEALPIGAMIETPAAAVAADTLAKRVSFFSIGTNDLIQYTLAVDRLNERIAHLYEPTSPAIIRLIKMTVDAAHDAGIKVSVCGEMAGDPSLTPLLLGLGVDELSTAPSQVPRIKHLVRHLDFADARQLAEAALQNESGVSIAESCNRLAEEIAPSLFVNK